MGLLRKQQREAALHKSMIESTTLLEQALHEWQANCPGAGWEHHNTQALATLVMTPSMHRLLELAAKGVAAEAGSDVEELRHIAHRIYPTNPQYEEVQRTYRKAVAAAEAQTDER